MTGRVVVDIAMDDVTTVVERAGQLVTSGPQLVMVTSLKLNTVDVVKPRGGLVVGDRGVELGVEVGEVEAIVAIVDGVGLEVVDGLVAGVLGELTGVLLGIEEVGLLVGTTGTEVDVIEVDATVATVELLGVDEAVGIVEAGVEED